jgi:phosphatidylserine decarboxylase
MQISGALARTIVPWTGVGDTLRRGERYGMIRLGSRVDVRVPASLYAPNVISAEDEDSAYPKGQFIKAGLDIIFKPIPDEE